MSGRRRSILMLTTQLGYGGAETSFIRLANYLAQSMDVTVALFTSDYGEGAYTKGHEQLNASVMLLDKPRAGRVMRWVRRIMGVRRLKAQHDVCISFLSGPNLVNALAGHSSRTIVSLRGSRCYDPVAPRAQRLLFQYLLDGITFARAARIVPVSAGLAQEVKLAAGRRALAKVCTIPPFVEVETIASRLAEPVPDTYRSLQGQPVIVSVGRLSVEKGFHHLIRVVHALGQVQPGVKLLLVGDGPMQSALLALCAELGVAVDDTSVGVTAVLFAGYQKHVLPLMALGRVYALTSATEGFPSVLLEAMAAGIPVIAADTPWGARAILRKAEQADEAAYPTQRATEADYGMLMPRIDLPEYQQVWVKTLGDYVHEARGVPAAAAERVREFDIAKVGAQWKSLIEAMVNHA